PHGIEVRTDYAGGGRRLFDFGNQGDLPALRPAQCRKKIAPSTARTQRIAQIAAGDGARRQAPDLALFLLNDSIESIHNSDWQERTSNIQHPTSNIQWSERIRHWALDVECFLLLVILNPLHSF